MDRIVYLVEETLVVVGPGYGAEFCEADLFGQSTVVVRDADPAFFLYEGGSCWSNVDGEEIGSLREGGGESERRRPR